VHDQGVPAVLVVEPGLDPAARVALERPGHRIVEQPALGAASAVGLRVDGTLEAAGDARKDGGEEIVGRP